MELIQATKPRAQISARWPKSRINELIQEYHRSNLSQKQFAQQAGVKYSTFTAWLARARRTSSAPPPSIPNWVAVELKAETRALSRPYQIQWTEGLSLSLSSGFNPEELRQLLSVLRTSCLR